MSEERRVEPDIDWDKIEDLADEARKAEHSVISGFDFVMGFKAGYLARLRETAEPTIEPLPALTMDERFAFERAWDKRYAEGRERNGKEHVCHTPL